MRELSLAVVASLVACSSALSDGLPDRGSPIGLPAAQSWTGFYIGTQGGYAWGTLDAFFALQPNADGFLGTQDYNIDGAFAGGLVGFNYQLPSTRLVIGAEADLSAADIAGQSEEINVGVRGDFYDTRIDWFGTVRARLGYTWGASLLYATGGLAYGNVRTRYIDPSALGNNNFSLSQTATGWTAGGGLEWTFASSWTARIEYGYVDLGDQALDFGDANNFTSFETEFHSVKAGVTYRF